MCSIELFLLLLQFVNRFASRYCNSRFQETHIHVVVRRVVADSLVEHTFVRDRNHSSNRNRLKMNELAAAECLRPQQKSMLLGDVCSRTVYLVQTAKHSNLDTICSLH